MKSIQKTHRSLLWRGGLPSRIVSLILSLALCSSSFAWHENKVLSALGSPDAVAALAFSSNILIGLAEWQWAYNWTRAGASPEENAAVQEAGGLVAAGLTWSFVGIVPFYFYLYTLWVKVHKDPAAAVHDLAALHGFDWLSNILSTPFGMATMAFLYALLGGGATLAWAYNWRRAGVSANATAVIQEAGGLASAGLSFLGAIVPLYSTIYGRRLVNDPELLPTLTHYHPILNAFAGPIGIAFVNFVFNTFNGVATVVWAYDWTRNGLSAAMTGKIQEIGGLVSAGLSWTLSGIVLFYLHLYKRHIKTHPASVPLGV